MTPCHCGRMPTLINGIHGMFYHCLKCDLRSFKATADEGWALEEWEYVVRNQTPASVAFAKQPPERKLFGWSRSENTLHVHLFRHLWTIIKRREK